MKTCAKCNEGERRGKSAYCGPCGNARNRAYYHAKLKFDSKNQDRKRAWNRQNHQKYHLARYGLTVEERELMEREQNGRCAICLNERPLCVDHDHGTGVVRGLLCQTCNAAIGFLEDDVESLRRAIAYLGGQF